MSRWIFLRGLTRDSRHWGEFPAMFQHGFPEADIVPLDLPGNGRLYPMQSPDTISAMVDYCRNELRARHYAPPYHVLAMSLGAIVSVDWAARYPQELAACVLINTSLRPLSPFYQRLRPANYPVILKLLLSAADGRDWEEKILRMTSNLAEKAANRAQILADWTRWRTECPVSRDNALRQLWAASRYVAPTHKPEPPLLVLASANDHLVSPNCSRRLAQLWQTDFAEHPGAGHDLPLDDGPWVVQQVRAWRQIGDENR